MENSLKGTKTEQNLLKAFAGESQAKNRYEFFAKQAKKEGLEQIAAIFMETAKEEQAHAKRFFSFLEGGMVEITASYPAGKVGTTKENLKEAAEGESLEIMSMYPKFVEEAEKEGRQEAAESFRIAMEREKHHRAMFHQALKLLK